ncbi:MAG: aminoacyl-tRNA hydrolase [Candidatus Zixiibacteriota bacterium]
MITAIIGLGNIGDEYTGTRHNIGFEAVRLAATRLRCRRQQPTELYDLAIEPPGCRKLVFIWPRTFMNRSGLAVQPVLSEYKLDQSNMLVVVDDFNLPLGKTRLRRGGSDGGHNGLASIADTLDSSDFPRLRLGIGPPPDNGDIVGFVLSRFTEDEEEVANKVLAQAAEAIIFALYRPLDEVMGQLNSNPA